MAMLQIGPVAFEVAGPSYQSLKSKFKRDWARQKRFGRRDAMQNTGIGEDSVEVHGLIYTDYQDGFGAIATLKAISGVPQMVVSGDGDVYGLWCITSVDADKTYPDAQGRTGKVAFTVKLEAYGEDGDLDIAGAGGLAGTIAAAVAIRLW